MSRSLFQVPTASCQLAYVRSWSSHLRITAGCPSLFGIILHHHHGARSIEMPPDVSDIHPSELELIAVFGHQLVIRVFCVVFAHSLDKAIFICQMSVVGLATAIIRLHRL